MTKADQRGKGRTWRMVRKAAYDRDSQQVTRLPDGRVEVGARCWLCGEPIDYAAPPLDPYAWEPDHRIPVCRRPDLQYDLANIMPSHSKCNRARGDGRRVKPTQAGLGTPSRRWGPQPDAAQDGTQG